MTTLSNAKYDTASDAEKRILAVSAALELIAVRITNNTTNGILEAELNRLSGYADTIQAAITKK